MRFTHWLVCAVTGPWLLIAAPFSLMFGVAVNEALIIALAGFGLVVAAGVFLAAELHGQGAR